MTTLASRTCERWQRIGLAVRLAYNPSCSCTIACYVGVGREISRRGYAAELGTEQRMFRLLLQTGADLALPWAWRHQCLGYAADPLERLATLLAHEPFTVAALQARLALAKRQLSEGKPPATQ